MQLFKIGDYYFNPNLNLIKKQLTKVFQNLNQQIMLKRINGGKTYLNTKKILTADVFSTKQVGTEGNPDFKPAKAKIAFTMDCQPNADGTANPETKQYFDFASEDAAHNFLSNFTF